MGTKYDAVLGTLPRDVSMSSGTTRVGAKSIKVLVERNPPISRGRVRRGRRGVPDRGHAALEAPGPRHQRAPVIAGAQRDRQDAVPRQPKPAWT
jgi:hypothetical protein